MKGGRCSRGTPLVYTEEIFHRKKIYRKYTQGGGGISLSLSICLSIYLSIHLSLYSLPSLSLFLSLDLSAKNAKYSKKFFRGVQQRSASWNSLKIRKISLYSKFSVYLYVYLYVYLCVLKSRSILIYLPRRSNCFHTATLRPFSYRDSQTIFILQLSNCFHTANLKPIS